MEDMKPYSSSRRVAFVVSTSALVGLILFLMATLVVALREAGAHDGARQEAWLGLALLSLALLGVALVLLIAMISRRLAKSVDRRQRREPTKHLDAWAVAGQRFQLPADEDRVDETDDDAEDDDAEDDAWEDDDD